MYGWVPKGPTQRVGAEGAYSARGPLIIPCKFY